MPKKSAKLNTTLSEKTYFHQLLVKTITRIMFVPR